MPGAVVIKTAVISPCGQFRYRLGRRWADGPELVFVMLNPSTADAERDDPTIRRCIAFAKAHGYSAIEVVNLFAYRATDPSDLRAAGCPVGPENDRHIDEAMPELPGVVCVAWGDRARGLARPGEVLRIIERALAIPCSLAVTKHGMPAHPLMLRADCCLQPYHAPKA
jgi:hypothetical protein